MKSPPETRYSLIGKLRNPQDAEAWSEFASLYQPLIFRICRAKGLQFADATDVTQEVLTRVAIAIEKFGCDQQKGKFRAWLYQITRNLVVDFFRNKNKNLLVQNDLALRLASERMPTRDESAEFQLAFQRQVFWMVAQDVRKQVKPETWTAFWDTEIKRKAVSDVAHELAMTVGAVYVARSRVLARFKKETALHLNDTREHFV